MSAPGSQSLLSVLRRGQLRVALVALLAVGAVLTLVSALSLRHSQLHNLELLGRSIAYSAEAAVVFRDAGAAREVLLTVVESEQLAGARIVLASGETLAAYERPRQGALSRWLFPTSAAAAISYEGRVVGSVQLQGDSSLFLRTLAWSLAGVLAGMALTGVAVLAVSRRLEHLVVDPLRALAAHTRAIRDERAYARRAPPAEVQEIDALGADFNALLAEVQLREAELLSRHQALQSDHERLSHKARHDSLTGVASRAYFEQRLAQAVVRARADGTRLGLLFVDADRFKQINDQHGHEAGDRVLSALAQRLRAAVREHDLVGRLGGDEFVVLIEPLRQPGDAERVAQQIRQAVLAPVDLGAAGTIVPGASIGVAVYPEQGDSAADLLRAADAAMYLSKQQRARAQAPAPGE